MTTLLIEKLNENQKNFIDYICDTKETNLSLSDAEVKTIREALVVNSMDEIIERFSPQITVEFKEEQITIPLCNKDGFFRQLVSLWEIILQGKYTDITKKDLEESLLTRDSVSDEEYRKAQEQVFYYLQGKRLQDAKAQMKKCIESFDDTLFYIKRLLVQAEKFLQKTKTNHRRFVVETEEGMSLQSIAVSEAFLESGYHTRRQEEVYQQLLEQVFEDTQTKEISANEQWKRTLIYWNMLLACQNLSEQKKEELQTVLEEQKVIYDELKESFWWQAKPILQTLLNCYFYLKKQGMGELLITNCTVEELADDGYKKALLRYLETVNQKQYQEDAIAKVLLPNVEEKKKKETLTRERFVTASKTGHKLYTNELKSAKEVQSIFAQFEIETRMIRCDEGEGFGYAITGIDVLKQSFYPEETKLRELAIWLNEWKLQGEEE